MIAKALKLDNIHCITEFIKKILVLKFSNNQFSVPYRYLCPEVN